MSVDNNNCSIKWTEVPKLPIRRPVGTIGGMLVGLAKNNTYETRLQIYNGERFFTGAQPSVNRNANGWAVSGAGLLANGSAGFCWIPESDIDDSSATATDCTFHSFVGSVSYDTTGIFIPRQFCDCGDIAGMGRLLLFLEYTSRGKNKNIWFSSDYAQVGDWNGAITTYPVDTLLWHTPVATEYLYRALVTPQTTEPGVSAGWEGEWEQRESASETGLGIHWWRLNWTITADDLAALPAWSGTAKYATTDMVSHGGKYYKSAISADYVLVPRVTTEPGVGGDWTEIVEGDVKVPSRLCLSHWHGAEMCRLLGKQAKTWVSGSYGWGTLCWHNYGGGDTKLYRANRYGFASSTNEPGSAGAHWEVIQVSGSDVLSTSQPRVIRAAGVKDYVDGKLLLMGGDDSPETTVYSSYGTYNNACALLVCDDVYDLILNPNTWFDRWGLLQNARDDWELTYNPNPVLDAYGTPRSVYNTGDVCSYAGLRYVCNEDGISGTWDASKWTQTGSLNFDPQYVAGHGWQHWRMVGGAYDPITQEFYFVPDQEYEGGTPCIAVDLSASTHTSRYVVLQGGGVFGCGWMGLYHEGNVILTMASYPANWLANPNKGIYTVDVWGLTADRLNAKRLKRIDRVDFNPKEGRTSSTAPAYTHKIVPFGGQYVLDVGNYAGFIEQDLLGLDLTSGTATPNSFPVSGIIRTYRNLFFNGTFSSWETGGTPSGTQPQGLTFYTPGTTHAREQSSFVPNGHFGLTLKSLKTTMASQVTAGNAVIRMQWAYNPVSMVWANEAAIRPVVERVLEYLRGKQITATMSVYYVSGVTATALASIVSYMKESGKTADSFMTRIPQAAIGGVGNTGVGRWMTGSCSFRITDNAELGNTFVRFNIQETSATGISGIVYVANVGVYEGVLSDDDLREISGINQGLYLNQEP